MRVSLRPNDVIGEVERTCRKRPADITAEGVATAEVDGLVRSSSTNTKIVVEDIDAMIAVVADGITAAGKVKGG